MNFLNPWFAAGVAAVVVPALLLLYFLKLRRREELVPSTLLWKRAVQDLQVNAPFQRLRRNLLLLLQLLILAAAIFALARPIIETEVTDESRVVILIDRSASMNAREQDQTRLDAAKEQAVRLVRTFNQRGGGWRSWFTFAGAPQKTQVMVIAFSDRAAVVSPFTTNTSDLVDLIRRIEPTDARTDIREALSLAEAYMAPPTRLTKDMEAIRESQQAQPGQTPVSAESPSRLVLISDGRIGEAEQIGVRAANMQLIRIGETRDNVGITTLRTQRNYERPESLNVFLTVKNFGTDPIQSDVSLYVDGTLRAVESVNLASYAAPTQAPAGDLADRDVASSRSLSFELLLNEGAVLEARLARPDALSADNQAFVVVPPPRRQSVLVVTKGNYFLDSVLKGLPLNESPFVRPDQFTENATDHTEEGQSKYDVVIYDKVAPQNPPIGNYLLLGVLPPVEKIKAGDKLEKHTLIWWDETHPVLRHVSLDRVYVAESRAAELPPEAEVLIEGPHGPVLFRYADGGRHYLCLTFAIEDTNWWSKPGFPVFMYNAIRYLGGAGAESQRGPVHPGDTLQIPVPPDVDTVRLVRPDEQRITLSPDTSGTAYYGGTEDVGIYRVEDGVSGRARFAVNLEDAAESDITPSGEVTVGNQQVTEMAAIRTATPEVWRWFVGAALVLLILEWWVYNRRVML